MTDDIRPPPALGKPLAAIEPPSEPGASPRRQQRSGVAHLLHASLGRRRRGPGSMAEPCAPPAVSWTPRGLAAVPCSKGGGRWARPNEQAERERAQKDFRRTRVAGSARAGGWTHVSVGQARAPPLGSTHPRLLYAAGSRALIAKGSAEHVLA